MASLIRFFAAVACLLVGGAAGVRNPQPIAPDPGLAPLHASPGLGVLVALLPGVLAGVVAPLRQRLRHAQGARVPATEPGS